MNKILLTNWKSNIAAFHFMQDRLCDVFFWKKDDEKACVGDIYVGKVTKIITGVGACFVNYCKEDTVFLALKEITAPILLNRSYDGSLKCGDEVLIQISKEAGKGKQPSATTNLSLSGNYCVVSLENRNIACSGKMAADEKTFWKKTLQQKLEENEDLKKLGIIVRTNAHALTDEELLVSEWKSLNAKLLNLIEEGSHRPPFTKIFSAEEGYLSYVKNMKQDEVGEIVTDSEMIYENIQLFFKTRPDILSRLRLYKDDKITLAKLYGLETKLSDAVAKKVWLNCGGFLYIEPTEALTVIDVNSGKFEKKAKPDEYHYLVNKEAVYEIALQLRLRNLSGIIVVDFINMKSGQQRDEIMNLLAEELKKDSLPAAVVDMTKLGLVEITRKKALRTLYEQLKDIS